MVRAGYTHLAPGTLRSVSGANVEPRSLIQGAVAPLRAPVTVLLTLLGVVACGSTAHRVSSVAVPDHVLAPSCQQGDPKACQKACDDGHATSCVEAGRNAELGLDGLRSGVAATAYYRRACELGSLDGCYNAGYSLEVGLNGRKDVGCALAMYRMACDAGHGRACMAAGMVHATGSEHVEQDLEASQAAYQKGCALGYAPACKFVKSQGAASTTVPPNAPSASASAAPSASASAASSAPDAAPSTSSVPVGAATTPPAPPAAPGPPATP